MYIHIARPTTTSGAGAKLEETKPESQLANVL